MAIHRAHIVTHPNPCFALGSCLKRLLVRRIACYSV